MNIQLKETREKRGMTQSELARAAGVSRQVISSIESNDHFPSLKLALKIASLLEAKVEDLFSNEAEGVVDDTEILTKMQRLVLVNQYALLKHVTEEHEDDTLSKDFEYKEQIFERGYTYLYGEALEPLWKEMPASESKEVISILNLHRAMLWSLGPDPDPEKVKAVAFQGFDASYEASYYSFATFFQQEPGPGRFRELEIENSHHSTLRRYRRMLEEWSKLKQNHKLTWKQTQQILDAGR